MRFFFIILFCGWVLSLQAQTLGGQAAFTFLQMPATPRLTALGGINVSDPANDIGLAFNNPALLQPSLHWQLNTVVTAIAADVKSYHASLGLYAPKIATSFGWGLHYIDYGSVPQTDAAGNVMGRFMPRDWVMQVMASRQYLEKWHYGITLKYIQSAYGSYRSNGIAADVGVQYRDTAAGLSVSLLAKNMGTQLRQYVPGQPEDIPFDLQAGISKRLRQAPFSFSLTAHHLHQFDIGYQDRATRSRFSIDQLLRHFVLATTVYLGDRVELTAGYNYLRRKELRIGEGGNGLTGFSLGAVLLLRKLQVQYARSQYLNNKAYNQFGINLALDQLTGLGKK
ncbi:MAG: type IX secretion system protein PorQ [Chitinophagaceae bacterium]